jgi:prepilin-type N-terminal cleavage/methylation domain-containing protein/prepilin-type processing-associated H-X9-DG protein
VKLTPAGKLNRQIPLKNTLVYALLNLKYMKLRFSNQRNHALTLIEVLVVIFVLAVIVVIILPGLAAAKRRSSAIVCINNVKQIGLSFRVWAGDNGDKFPMEVSVTNGGAMELAITGNAVAVFRVMSNELSTPKILVCQKDRDRTYATNFDSGLTAKNISYFVGLDANTNFPQAFLSGDDNFAIRGIPVKSGLLEISSNTLIAWSAARHKFSGNILLADGSVQSANNSMLTNWPHQLNTTTNRLAIP